MPRAAVAHGWKTSQPCPARNLRASPLVTALNMRLRRACGFSLNFSRVLPQPYIVLGDDAAVPEVQGFFEQRVRQLAAVRGRGVSVWYDHDDAGRQGELAVQKALHGVAASLEFVHWLTDLPEGFDIRDHVVELAVRAEKPVCYLQQLQALLRPEPRLGLVEGAASSFDQERSAPPPMRLKPCVRRIGRRGKIRRQDQCGRAALGPC